VSDLVRPEKYIGIDVQAANCMIAVDARGKQARQKPLCNLAL
jgi:hypothetical protein